ncbi:MAG TPA: hypothetical protein V6D20_02865, partial [Candidatus Obscuribacterales bacterium]
KSLQQANRGSMYPGMFASLHPAGPMLHQYGTTGTPVDIDADWTIDQLDQAVAYGSHPSARAPEAAQCVRDEALEKVKVGYCRVVKWSDMRQALLKGQQHTKISPLAAIPHKSRKFRMLLDLSAKARRTETMRNTMGTTVNDATNKDTAPLHSMSQLGSVLPRIIFQLATLSEEAGPIMSVKFDIKDGFWRMAVPLDAESEFCYPLPKLDPAEDTHIVIPASLQMGWTSSPPFFCAASETGRDIAEWLRLFDHLPAHVMEDATLAPTDPQLLHPFVIPSHWTDADYAAY